MNAHIMRVNVHVNTNVVHVHYLSTHTLHLRECVDGQNREARELAQLQKQEAELKQHASELKQRNDQLHEHLESKEKEIQQMKDQYRQQLDDEIRTLHEEKQQHIALMEKQVCFRCVTRMGRKSWDSGRGTEEPHLHALAYSRSHITLDKRSPFLLSFVFEIIDHVLKFAPSHTTQQHKPSARDFAGTAAPAAGRANATRQERGRA